MVFADLGSRGQSQIALLNVWSLTIALDFRSNAYGPRLAKNDPRSHTNIHEESLVLLSVI